jgi:hypothetical protein
MAQHYLQSSIRGQQPVDTSILQMLQATPAYQRLDAPTQAELAESLAKISGYLRPGNQALAEQLAPADLRSRLSPQAPANQPQSTQPGNNQAAAPPAGDRSATMRAGEVARATLSAINFPEFVASLIQGTFQAIVDASIQQMEAYAELLKNVALTIDQFMSDNISDGMARDYLADRYDTVFTRDTTTAQPVLRVREDAADEPLPSFFRGLGFDTPADIDQQAISEVVVPETRRTLAEQRQQMLATMVLMGINRVVVDDGEITAKLQFHIDASETLALKFDQTKTTVGNLAGHAGKSAFSGNGIMVNTTSMNAQSDVNVRADLTGQVKVRFRSETFPLERFADSAAIQLINSRATAPGQAPAQSIGGAPTPTATSPVLPVGNVPAAQSLALPAEDPWVPGGIP